MSKAISSIFRWSSKFTRYENGLDSFCRSHSRAFSDLPDDFLPVVAIIGRPNVGKSALFNRLIKSRQALVHNTPTGHVTRDYQEAPARLGDLQFLAMDTSGLEPFLPSGTIQARATALTSQVLQRADVALFLIDGREGVLPPDAALARWLRESIEVSDKVILAANKCERRTSKGESGVGWALAEATILGYGEPVALSAESGEGMIDLYQELMPRLDPILKRRREAITEIGGDIKEEERSKKESGYVDMPMKAAIMGLTNVGKSTLTNWLLQKDRCLTGPEPGLTRDAIATKLKYNKRDIELIDTAGWVRKTRLPAHDDSGGIVAARTLEEARTVLRFVHVVVLVIDALRVAERNEGLTHAEATLASHVVEEGRALVVVVNKIDGVASMAGRVMELVRNAMKKAAPNIEGTLLAASALTGQHDTADILPTALSSYDTWNKRISTSRLNRWLENVTRSLGPGGGSDLRRIKYISQVKARPPTFVVFVSGEKSFDDATQRFLANQLRSEFGLSCGVPLRVVVRYKSRHRDEHQGGVSFKKTSSTKKKKTKE